jgi:PEP-CTERM motif
MPNIFIFPLDVIALFGKTSRSMNEKNTQIDVCRSAARTIKSTGRTSFAAVVGLAFVAANATYAQVSSINSAYIDPRVFDDIPSATLISGNSYPTGVSFIEQNVSSSTGYANRDVWYFSNNGGTSPYQFQNNDYFKASFEVTLYGGSPGYDLEAGFLFSNPSGSFGGDLQTFVTAAGVVAQVGGPSYYPFSPAAGGYPGAGGSVPNYATGETYTMGLNYLIDPVTGLNAFQYSVNGQLAASSPGDTYFDLGPGVGIGGAGDYLGGYFQIQTDPNNPNNSGVGAFSSISITTVPEPSSFALLGVGVLTALPRFLRGRRN